MQTIKMAFLIAAKAIFCLLLAYALVAIIFGSIMTYFQFSFPFGLLAIPVAFGMFMFFSKLEKDVKERKPD